MTEQCCTGGRKSRRLPRRLSVASILPGVVLVLLPKCPLCLAAWLTLATGISFSAAGAAWVPGSIVLLWLAAAALFVWQHAFDARDRVFVARTHDPTQRMAIRKLSTICRD